jgi:hypothetical protein
MSNFRRRCRLNRPPLFEILEDRQLLTMGKVTIAATTAFTKEGSSNPGIYTLTANPAPSAPLNITYTLDSLTNATLGTDFTLSPASLVTIAAGATTATINVGVAGFNGSPLGQLGTKKVVMDLTGVTVSGSGGSSYTIGSPSQATVTIRYNDVSTTPQVDSLCPTCEPNLFPSSSASDGGDPGQGSVSDSGIRYGDGEVEDADPDLTSSGFGELFGPSLEWSNLSGLSNNSSYGVGMVDSSLPSLQQTANGGILAVNSGTGALQFDNQSGTYVAEFYEGSEFVLQPDGSSGDFMLTDPYGDVARFYGFETSLPTAQQGHLKSFTDPDGNAITTRYLSGQLAEVQRSATTSGVTTTESFLYTYVSSGFNTGSVQNVTLRREVGSGGWTTIRQAVFT